MDRVRPILADLAWSAANARLWWSFAWLDIKLRYRRTLLGPFWMTFNFTLQAAAMGIVFSTLFKINIHEFLPYLVAGLAAWTLLSSLVIEGCNTFIGASAIILRSRIPLSFHVFRSVARNMFVFAHNFIVILLVNIWFRVPMGSKSLLVIPALVLFVANGLWVSLFLGIWCTRFRDLPQATTLAVSVVFFITPVFWHYDMLGFRTYLGDANPFYHFVEVLRAPLLGQAPAPLSWAVTCGCTITGWTLALAIAAKFGRRIAYWL